MIADLKKSMSVCRGAPEEPSRDLALVGAGYWGKHLARNFQALGVLKVICDPAPQTLASFSTGYDEVTRTPDFQQVIADSAITKVAVAAPAALHYELAKAALLAGKDVFVEKPLCLHVWQASELVVLAADLGRILMVGHLLQYHPCIRKIQELLACGDLGKLFYIASNRLNLGKIRHEENALWSFAPHDLSVILSLAGNQVPEQIRCTGEAYLKPGVADTTLTSMRFRTGVRAHVFVSWLNPFKEQKLTVIGSEAMAVFDDTRPWTEKLMVYREYLTWSQGAIPVPNNTTGESIKLPELEPLRSECEHFLQCCRSRCVPRTDAKEGLRVLSVLEAAQQSLDSDGAETHPATPVSSATIAPEAKQVSGPAPGFFVHPTAVVDDGAEIGPGTKVWHFSHIMRGARIGACCVLGQNVNVDGGTVLGNNIKVQNNVSIFNGCHIEDDVFLGPSCVLTNVTNPRSQVNRRSLYEKTIIRRGATVGANATIVCGVTVGQYAFIGAGAVVTRDVPDYALMIGNPARQRGWVSRHGVPLRPEDDSTFLCPESGYRYELRNGSIRCIDLPEDQPLPVDLRVGTAFYDSFKSSLRGVKNE